MSGFIFNIQDVFNNSRFANQNAIQACNSGEDCNHINRVDDYWMTSNQFQEYLNEMLKSNPMLAEQDNLTRHNVTDMIDTAWMSHSNAYPMEVSLNTKDLENQSMGLQKGLNFWLREYMNTYNAHHLQLEKNSYQPSPQNMVLDNHDEEEKYQEKMIQCQTQLSALRERMASMGFVTELKGAIREEFQGKLSLVRGNRGSAELIQLTYNQDLYYTETAYDENYITHQCRKVGAQGTDGMSYQSTQVAPLSPRAEDSTGNFYIDDDRMCQIKLGKDYSNISLKEQQNSFAQGPPNYLCCGKNLQENARLVSVQGYKFYQPGAGSPFYLVNENKTAVPKCDSVYDIGNLATQMGYGGNTPIEQGDPDEIGIDVNSEEQIDVSDYPYKLTGKNCNLVKHQQVRVETDTKIYPVSVSIYVIKVSKTFQQIQGLAGGYNPLSLDIGMDSGFAGSGQSSMGESTQDYYQPLQIVIEYKDHVKPPIIFTKSFGDTSKNQLQQGFDFLNKIVCGPQQSISKKKKKQYDNSPLNKYPSLVMYHPSTDKFQVSENFPHFRKDNYF
jgi:hypothetical protein